MSNFLIQSFRGGLSDYEDKGAAGAFKAGTKAIDIRKKVDSLTCQQALVSETGTFTAIINFFVVASDGYTYGFARNGDIYQRDPTTKVWTLKYTDSNETTTGIIGAMEWYDKNTSTGVVTTYLMWATATRLNVKNLYGLSNWSDVNVTPRGTWPKTNLTSSEWHTMKQANGLAEICNASSLAQVGYNDNSYTTSALDLIPGNETRSLIERNARTIVIGCGIKNRDQSTLFEWDGDDSWMNKNIIPIGKINAIIDGEKPLMQVGTNGMVYYSLFDSICPLTQFPGGGQVNPGGTDIDQGLILFGVWNSGTGNTGIYTFGRKYLAHPLAMNLEYPFDCDEIGAVCKTGTEVIFSYKSGVTYGVKRIDSANKAVGYYYSLDLKAPNKAINQKPVWGKVVVSTAPMVSGTKIECYYKADKTGSFVKAKLSDVGGGTTSGIDEYSVVGGKEAIFLVGVPAKIFEFKLVLTPTVNTSPEIYKIEVYFD